MGRKSQEVKLSIILPTHNRADVLAFAIESVLYQSFLEYELLIVGDGCTDQTAQVVKSFKDSRIRWLDLPKAPNYGYANRNIAFKQAQGEYIGFMAHDDIILPDHFELLINHLEHHSDLELVYSRPGWVTRDGLLFGIEFNLLNLSTRIPFMQRRHNALPASCVVHRKSCFEKYGYWNSDLASCGDWDMWIRIISGGNERNFDFLPEVTCLHFVAIWKQNMNSGLREAVHWRALYESGIDMPTILRRHIPEGKSEQEVFWNEIQADPIAWSYRLRQAIIRITDLRVETLVRQNVDLQTTLQEVKEANDRKIKQIELRQVEHLLNFTNHFEKLEQSSQEIHEEILILKQDLNDRDIKQKDIDHLNNQIRLLQKNREELYNSYSWKIGRSVTKLVDFFFGWIPGIKW